MQVGGHRTVEDDDPGQFQLLADLFQIFAAEHRFDLRPHHLLLVGDVFAARFDELLQRIHPAASRIRRLAQETPSTLVVFDLLVNEEGKSLVMLPLAQRRAELERFINELPKSPHLSLSPATANYSQAEIWYRDWAIRGCDGVLAKPFEPQLVIGRVKELLAKAPPRRTDADLTVDLQSIASPAPEPIAELDAYFDRLDAAFAKLPG